MSYQWTDVLLIAEDLSEKHPEIDPRYIRFTELHRLVCDLANFSDDPKRSNEKILEAIQSAWIDEAS